MPIELKKSSFTSYMYGTLQLNFNLTWIPLFTLIGILTHYSFLVQCVAELSSEQQMDGHDVTNKYLLVILFEKLRLQNF